MLVEGPLAQTGPSGGPKSRNYRLRGLATRLSEPAISRICGHLGAVRGVDRDRLVALTWPSASAVSSQAGSLRADVGGVRDTALELATALGDEGPRARRAFHAVLRIHVEADVVLPGAARGVEGLDERPEPMVMLG